MASFGAGPERREAFATRFGSRPFDSIEALCADPEVDLVVVSLPNHLHARPSAAAAAGKAVACTKPLGRKRRGGRRHAPRRHPAGVFHAYLENVVFNLDIMRMRQMIDAGSIGRSPPSALARATAAHTPRTSGTRSSPAAARS